MFRRSFSSEDSELSESLVNPKSAIRVSVCLQRYFKDFRARCYILVVRNRRVRWLEKRIQKIFTLPGSFCLCTNGHLLPSSEPLSLLRPDDSVEVIPLLEVQVLHKRDAIALNKNNILEKYTLYEEKVSDSPQKHNGVNHSDSVNDQHQTILDEADYNKGSRTSEEVVDMCQLETTDDIDGITSMDTSLMVNNNNSTCPEDMNIGHENDRSHTLQKLKRHALALLDGHPSVENTGEAVAEEPPPRRARRRVRRRTRRSQQPEQEPAFELESQLQPEPRLCPQLELDTATTTAIYCLNTVPASNGETPIAGALPPQSEVARNEAACSRRPRIVRSLEIEN